MEEQAGHLKYAVLIDGDNAKASLLPLILTEISKVGLLTIKRIYGDWTTSNMNSWKDPLHELSIQPIQQFRYTRGKNSTDNAMIIDAMDILHSNHVDGFCIVASDSDYTRLAMRIREAGLSVIGVGEKKTPSAFINACNKFIYYENLFQAQDIEKVTEKKLEKSRKKERQIDENDPLPVLLRGFEMAAEEEEWVHLASMGYYLRQLYPAFDPRTYGHKRLQSLIKKYPDVFAIKLDETKTPPVVFIALSNKLEESS